jgi:hypothetical protein
MESTQQLDSDTRKAFESLKSDIRRGSVQPQKFQQFEQPFRRNQMQ